MRKINQLITKRAMPYHILFVRHGESESNVIQQLAKSGQTHPLAEAIANRPDWQQRLTKKGIDQAKSVGDWIKQEFGSINNFEGCYSSPFLRARETASYIGGDKWYIDDRIVERFRGVHGVEFYEQDQLNQLLEIRDTSPWYARPDWGESLQDVFGRYRIFQSSIKRHHADEKVIVVTHGDFIKTARYSIEWMMPEDWREAYLDHKQDLPNGGIIHYSRINPYNPTEISPGVKWVRVINPYQKQFGKWRELNIKRGYSASELRQSVQKTKTLFDD